MTKACIGLFGTCGKSTFRKDLFIPRYRSHGLSEEEWFNPQKEDWKPEDAAIEADHLANDQVILFPVTGETYATGSLAEVGFSILSAIKLDDRRDIVVAIEPILDAPLMEDKILAKESLRARALVSQHLLKLRLSNLFLIDTGTSAIPRPRQAYLTDMLELSLALIENAKRISSFKAKWSKV